MSKSVERKIEKKIWFEENHREDLRSMRGLIDESMSIMIGDINKIPSEISLDKAIELEQKNQLEAKQTSDEKLQEYRKGRSKSRNRIDFHGFSERL
jgi:hypothetical protein